MTERDSHQIEIDTRASPREGAPANDKRILGAAILVSLTEKISIPFGKLGSVFLLSNAICFVQL